MIYPKQYNAVPPWHMLLVQGRAHGSCKSNQIGREVFSLPLGVYEQGSTFFPKATGHHLVATRGIRLDVKVVVRMVKN